MANSFYAKIRNNTYVNTYYALNIALDEYLSTKLLEGDSTRIIISSTEYALVKRSGQNPWNNANLPFINYRMDDKDFGGARNWFNFSTYSQGVYVPELQKKVRITPVTINYDCSIWLGRDDDYQYALDQILIDNTAETKLTYNMDYNGVLIPNIAIVDFAMDAANKFNEQDWLTQNQIWSFNLNPNIQTFLFLDNISGFCVPKKVIINFLIKKDLIPASDGETIEYEEAFTMLVDHFNSTVTLQ